jgi:hypothetical protein
MTQSCEYRGFWLSFEQTPPGWRVRIASVAIHIPHHLQQVIRPEMEDAIAEAKSMIDYMIGQ